MQNKKLAYNVAEAAEALGIGRTAVYALIKAGKLQSFKLGGRTLIRADVLQNAIDDASGISPDSKT